MGIEKKLVYGKDGKIFEKKIHVLENEKKIHILSNPIAWRILKSISDKPKYTAQIAKELKIYEQSAYYYIKKLIFIDAIKEVGTDFVRGGTAKLYQCASPSFGIEMSWGENLMVNQTTENNKNNINSQMTRKFLH